ncbi:MAG TPA: hypothetical protein VF559_12750 [Caulobacteraceae bacterium]|jgi:hypothetical protein
MDSDRISVLLGAYGADSRRWPEGDRAHTDLRDPALGARLDEARRTDELLGLSQSVVPSAALRERILASAPRERPVRRLTGGWLWRAAAGAGMAASLAAGLLVGWTAQAPAASDVNLQVALAAYSAPASAFGELELEEG